MSLAVEGLLWIRHYSMDIFLFLGRGFLIYLGATFLFDAFHWMLHRAEKSSWRMFKAIGSFHKVHHEFMNPRLEFDDTLILQNLMKHRLGEFVVHMVFVASLLFFLSPPSVILVLGFLVLQFLIVTLQKGKDSNHRSFKVVPAPRGGLLVGPSYHALHHRDPNQYFSSFTTTFDRLFGTGCSIEGRSVVMTGASGAFGSPFRQFLEGAGAKVKALKFGVDFGPGDYSRCDEFLSGADILVLAHGSKVGALEANCESFVALIERFRSVTRNRQFPPEVWAVGSEIECHPAWGIASLKAYSQSKRAYAKYARGYYWDRGILYRHIVPSAFTSPMGPGLISGRIAAAWAWFLIRRGFRYVPVTYTGIAFVNYFKFLFFTRALPRPVFE